MGPSSSLRGLAVAAVALLHPGQHALALAQAGGSTVEAAPRPWVTVDPSGGASTIVPSVFTTHGHRTTVQAAPSGLLSTATYTLSPDGRPSTYTGLPPVASATGGSGGTEAGGVFLACGNEANVGPDEPFCLPKRGSVLHPGRTYYITWSPSYFPSSLLLSLQAVSPDDGIGFTSDPLPASQGFYAWTIPPSFLSSHPGNPSGPVRITFRLAENDTASTPADPDPNDLAIYDGPTVYVAAAADSDSDPSSLAPGDGGGGGGPNAVAIAVPVVVVGVLLLMSGVSLAWWRRRRGRGTVPMLGGMLRRRSGGGGGYGVRQSRAERVGVRGGGWEGAADSKSETNVGVELTDRDSWSPTARSAAAAAGGGGRNVFREEVERQARLG